MARLEIVCRSRTRFGDAIATSLSSDGESHARLAGPIQRHRPRTEGAVDTLRRADASERDLASETAARRDRECI